MKKILLIIGLLSLLPLSSGAKSKGYYRVTLKSVDGTNGVISNPENSKGFTTPSFRDSIINITFSFEPTHIDFNLQNISKSTIKIIWDDAIYVGGVSGSSSGVFHSGVTIIDRDKPQVPSVIIKGSEITDLIVLKESVSYSSDFGRWMYSYILYWEDQLTKLKLLLPIEINGETREYLFEFAVGWENIKVKTQLYDGKEYYIEKK